MPGTHLLDFFPLVHETVAKKEVYHNKSMAIIYIIKKFFRVKKFKIDVAVCAGKSKNEAGDRDTLYILPAFSPVITFFFDLVMNLMLYIVRKKLVSL